MATFGRGSTSCGPDCSRDSQASSLKVNRRIQPSPLGNSPTHAHQQSVTSPTESDDFSRTRGSLSSIRTDTTNASEQSTPACSPKPSRPVGVYNPTGLDDAISQTFQLADSMKSSTSQISSQTTKLPLDQRRLNNPTPSSPGLPPQRPCSPPPKELVEKTQLPRTIQLTVPSAPSIRRSSYSSMPPPSTNPRAAKASLTRQGSKKKAATLSRANKLYSTANSRGGSPEMRQFGMALIAPVVHSSNEHIRRKMQLNTLAGMGGSAEQLSHRSRRQSFNSDRTDHTSDPGDDHMPRAGSNPTPTTTDPNAIHAITQTMIGEFLFKYTTKTLTRGFSEKRHRRFFWVHPYTKTLYWSTSDPGAHGANQSTAKSVLIESVRTIDDNNVAPSGLASHSLVIQTPNREMKITAPSKERHELWFSAINYLLTRPDPSVTQSPAMTTHPAPSPNPSTRGPAQSTFSSRNTMLSRFRGLDSSILQTPPAVHQAIYDISSSKSATDSPVFSSTASSERLTPKASKGPAGLPVPMKRGVAVSGGSAKLMTDSPRYLSSSPAEGPGHENSLNQSAIGLYHDPDRHSVSFNGVPRSHGENADDTDVSMSYDSRCDDNQDDGYEGVENVRACCDGKHDVGSLSRRHGPSSHHEQSHMPFSHPASRGTLSSQREANRTSYVSNRALRTLDSPSLRASNLEALRERYGGANSPGPQAQAQAQQTSPHLRRVHGKSSVVGQPGLSSSLQSSPAATVSSRFQRESIFFQDLKSFNQASVEQLQTPPPRCSSRFTDQYRDRMATSVRSTQHGSVGSDIGNEK